MIRLRPSHTLVFALWASLLNLGCATNAQPKAGRSDVAITSWLDVDFAALNAKIRKAHAANEGWVSVPQLYALHLFDVAETQTVDYHFSADRIEDATAVEAVIRRDGFADDAVRGDIHAIKLRRGEGRIWEIASLKRAMRCWRPEGTEYSAAVCR